MPRQNLAEAGPGVPWKNLAKAAMVATAATAARTANVAKAGKTAHIAKAAISFSLIGPDSLLPYSYLTFGPIILYLYCKLIQVL